MSHVGRDIPNIGYFVIYDVYDSIYIGYLEYSGYIKVYEGI